MSNQLIEKGNFIDERDGNKYEWVRLKDGKRWMATNLKYKPDLKDAIPYGNKIENIEKYGLLYGWEETLKSIPTGWRLPSKEDVEALIDSYMEGYSCYDQLIEGGDAGFNACLGGNCVTMSKKTFDEINEVGYYWTCSEAEEEFIHVFKFDSDLRFATLSSELQDLSAFSIRCICD